jgi:16S rRNA (adenine1518-N6/adenine1519-N6)-dimethyltransferase
VPRLSQHFLFDPRILARIADAVEARAGEPVLEIGPGLGSLTAVLAARGLRLAAIERDPRLASRLAARFPGVPVLQGDALELDWPAAAGAAPGEPWWVVGNIPYHITSPLLDKALAPPRPAAVVFLLQREVADRLSASPGSAAYGALSIGVQAVARVRRVFTVAAGAFRPVPRVDSAVVRLVPLPQPLVAQTELAGFRRLVVGLFGQRRRQLVRGLRTVTGWDPARVERVLARVPLPAGSRPEVLPPEALVALYRRLVDEAGGNGLGL